MTFGVKDAAELDVAMDSWGPPWHLEEVGEGSERRPGLARTDRGCFPPGFRDLVEDAEAFAAGALALPVGERRQFASVFARDMPRLSGARRAAMTWLAEEKDEAIAARLSQALLRAPCAYVEGETVWLVHAKGDALSVRECGVSYHRRPPPSLSSPSTAPELRDEAARRMWAHRRTLPAAARRFAPFF